MIATGAIYNLDDEGQRAQLEKDGLVLKIGKEAHFMVKENASTGFSWQIDESSCFDEGLASYETSQGTTHMEAAHAGTNDGIGSLTARNQMVGMPSMRYFTLEGEKAGSCEFRIYYARPWEFNLSDIANSSYGRKVIVPIFVVE